MIRSFSWMILGLSIWTTSAGADPWRDLGTGTSSITNPDGKPWFTVEKKRRTENGRIESELTYRNSAREPLSVESYATTPEGQLLSYQWSQKQTGREAQIDIVGQQLRMRLHSPPNAATEKNYNLDADDRANLIVPPMIDERILKNWNLLKSGKQIEFLVAIPDRQDYFRFRFTPERAKYEGGYSFMLRAASFLLSLAVAPIPFHFTADQKLERVENIPPPVKRLNINGELENTKTDILFGPSEKSDQK